MTLLVKRDELDRLSSSVPSQLWDMSRLEI